MSEGYVMTLTGSSVRDLLASHMVSKNCIALCLPGDVAGLGLVKGFTIILQEEPPQSDKSIEGTIRAEMRKLLNSVHDEKFVVGEVFLFEAPTGEVMYYLPVLVLVPNGTLDQEAIIRAVHRILLAGPIVVPGLEKFEE